MEKYIDHLTGVYTDSHIKQGIIVRKKRTREFVGLVVSRGTGVYIRTPFDQLFTSESNINVLLTKFSQSYEFYLL